MATVANAPRTPHPYDETRPGGWFDPGLVPVAAQLVGTLRDYGPVDVAQVLADVTDRDHLILTLAAMVDPDASPGDLIAWTRTGPVPSRRESPKVAACPDCGRILQAKHIGRHQQTAHAPQPVAEPVAAAATPDGDWQRLRAAGVSPYIAHTLAAQAGGTDQQVA